MVMSNMAFPERVAVLRVAAIVAATGIRIARSQVLAIYVGVEIRAIAGIVDNGLRQCWSYVSRRDNGDCANQREFHFWSPAKSR